MPHFAVFLLPWSNGLLSCCFPIPFPTAISHYPNTTKEICDLLIPAPHWSDEPGNTCGARNL
jgi:hypothetical protein